MKGKRTAMKFSVFSKCLSVSATITRTLTHSEKSKANERTYTKLKKKTYIYIFDWEKSARRQKEAKQIEKGIVRFNITIANKTEKSSVRIDRC